MNLRAISVRSAVDGRIPITCDRYRLVTLATVCALVLLQTLNSATASDEGAVNKAPRLILQITVDALRGDLPGRFAQVLGEGGFRYLQQGVNYTNAHYQHATTETIVGPLFSRENRGNFVKNASMKSLKTYPLNPNLKNCY